MNSSYRFFLRENNKSSLDKEINNNSNISNHNKLIKLINSIWNNVVYIKIMLNYVELVKAQTIKLKAFISIKIYNNEQNTIKNIYYW